MKNKIVHVPTIKVPIQECPGFAKKSLADYKLDLLALCGFGCTYCSSNDGNYLRINRSLFLELTEQQIGVRARPDDDPSLMFVWDDVLEHLQEQLARGRDPARGRGKTLVFSMLTDGFSPGLVEDGTTRQALDLVLEKTEFHIRVLTKNAIVGTKEWIDYFLAHPGRFVVGLSTGTLDDSWAAKIELGTSSPSARLAALTALQDAGVPTYGMLCPVFPDVLEGSGVETLVSRIRPERVEHVWAEPFNDRKNWERVRRGYAKDSPGYGFLTDVYECGRKDLWSTYATDLYLRLRAQAAANGWLDKLRYLLYEDNITEVDAGRLGDFQGILLQSKPRGDGLSRNPYIAERQSSVSITAAGAVAGGPW